MAALPVACLLPSDDYKDELCREIRESEEETRRLMRALHQEVMDQLEKLGEVLTSRRDELRRHV